MTTINETADASRPTVPVRPLTLGLGLRLDAGTDEKPCVWNVVAYEGEWKGHPAGAFQFSRATFEQIIANFRSDPRYARRAGLPAVEQASAEQVTNGAYDVIQWDFHHAAEMPAAEVAAGGAPAQGWVLELRLGEHDGKVALLALTRWLEPARTYIRTERYKYCSVSVWLSAVDPQTGKDVGAVLTSIAITNNPFLQGLPPLRASREAVLAGRHYFGPACDADDAVGSLRKLFAMPESAGLADVQARAVAVKAWLAGGSLPPGMDDDVQAADVLGGIRQILNLPLMTSQAETLAQLDSLLGITAAPIAPAMATRSPAGSAGQQQETRTMDTNTTGAQSSASDGAAKDGPKLRTALARIIAKQRNCSIDEVSDGHILAAMEGAAALQAKIDELMGTLGAKTLAEALAKMQAADDLKMKLSEALAGKAAAEDAMKEYEAGMVEEDVGMALASLGITDESKAGKIRKALLAERGSTPETIAAFRKTYDLENVKKAAREELIRAAQKTTASRSQEQTAPAHLTASIATERQTPPGAPPTQAPALTLTLGADGQVRLGAPQSRETAPGAGAPLTLAALRDRYPGEPNDYLRKVALVKAEHAKNNPNAPPLDHSVACERASALRIAA